MPSFSQKAFQEVTPILKAVYEHPFNRTLANGTLERSKFIFYMQQDSLYLIDFARALALTGARFTGETQIALMLKLSDSALMAERELHNHYFQLYQVVPASLKSPACLAYTSYLLTQATLARPAESLAALLPCFWIYRQVGRNMLQQAQLTGNPYAKWIEAYAGEAYEALVSEMLAFTDQCARQAGPEEQENMMAAFLTAGRLEYHFWDDAEQMRTWTV